MIKISKTQSLYFYITFSLVIFFISWLGYVFNCNLLSMEIGFTIVFLLTVIHSIYFYGLLSLYSVFLYTSAFFLYNCITLSIFTERKFYNILYPWSFSFTEDIGFKFIIVCFVAVFFGHIFYFMLPNYKVKYELKYCKKMEQIGSILMLISLFPVCFKIYFQLRLVLKYGYYYIFSDGFDSIKYPFWCSGAFLIFNSGYYLVVSSFPKIKKFIFYSIIYFGVSLFNAMKGARGGIISFIVTVLYLFQIFYNKKINFKNIVLSLVLIIFLTGFLGSFRENNHSENKGNGKIQVTKILENILWAQTSSRTVLLMVIKGDLRYHPYPFVFYPFTNLILKHIYHAKGSDILSLEKYNNPSQVTMANVSVNESLSGKGYGSVFIAEAYECFGLIGVVFFIYLLIRVIGFYDKNHLREKNIFLPFLYILLETIPIAPRKEIFQLIQYRLNNIIFVYLVFIIMDVLLIKRIRGGTQIRKGS